MRGLFITGTNTGVGKTWVTARLARRLRSEGEHVGVYKPACSGGEIDDDGNQFWPDIEQLHAALDGEFSRDWICPQRFAAPLAPHAAARLEGRDVDSRQLRGGIDIWRKEVDVLLVEGIGGWLCPITDTETVADLAVDMRFPVLLVAALELGAINHTLLTVESIERRGVPFAGIVLNETVANLDPTLANATSEAIASFAGCQILGRCAYGKDVEWSDVPPAGNADPRDE